MTEPASLPFFVGVDPRPTTTRIAPPRTLMHKWIYEMYGPRQGAIDLPRDQWSGTK